MAPLAVAGPLRHLLDGLGNKWTAAVIDALAAGEARFSDLLDQCHPTSKMLSRVLHALEADGIIARSAWPGGSGYSRYALTARGRDLHGHLGALDRWAAAGPGPDPPAAGTARLWPVSRAPRTGTSKEPGDREQRGEHPWSAWGRPRLQIALSTSDIAASARALAAVFGTRVPATSPARVMHKGTAYSLRVCGWRLQNIAIEVVQNLGTSGPFHDFLRARTAGIHHFSYYVDRAVAKRTLWLARHGDGVLWADESARYAAFDFRADFGVHIAIADVASAADAWPVAEVHPSAPLAQALHIGVVVGDLARTLDAHRRVFGTEVSPVRRLEPRFASTEISDPNADVHVARGAQPNVALHYCEPDGDSPIRRFLDRYGNGVFEIGFRVGRDTEAVAERLRGLGGRVIAGAPDDGYTVVAMPPEVGFCIGLYGQAGRRAGQTRRASAGMSSVRPGVQAGRPAGTMGPGDTSGPRVRGVSRALRA